MDRDVAKMNYYRKMTCNCQTEHCGTADQPNMAKIEINFEVNRGFKWGNFDSSQQFIVPISQFPAFPSESVTFLHFLHSPDEIKNAANLCQEDLAFWPGVEDEDAHRLTEKLERRLDQCVKDFYGFLDADENLVINLVLTMETVYDHNEYLYNQAVLESSNEWEFPVCPASDEAIEALGKFTVTVAEDESMCSVCTQEFVKGDEAIRMPCSHVFHSYCILTWLKNMNTCPNCRIEI